MYRFQSLRKISHFRFIYYLNIYYLIVQVTNATFSSISKSDSFVSQLSAITELDHFQEKLNEFNYFRSNTHFVTSPKKKALFCVSTYEKEKSRPFLCASICHVIHLIRIQRKNKLNVERGQKAVNRSLCLCISRNDSVCEIAGVQKSLIRQRVGRLCSFVRKSQQKSSFIFA